MTFRDWVGFFGQLILLGGAVAVPVAALAALRGDERWVTRKEWKVAEEHQAQRLAEVIMAPLKDIAHRMEAVAHAQGKMAEGQVRQEEINRAIGRSLDELRDDLQEIKEQRRA